MLEIVTFTICGSVTCMLLPVHTHRRRKENVGRFSHKAAYANHSEHAQHGAIGRAPSQPPCPPDRDFVED